MASIAFYFQVHQPFRLRRYTVFDTDHFYFDQQKNGDICRKVAEAKRTGDHTIKIWGDGEQTRSFMYIDDCLVGTQAIMGSAILEPLNLGSDELVSINQLVDIVEAIAGVKLKRRYKLDAPKGVRGRNSDNTLIKARLDWAPGISLRDGMEKTYRWIHDEMKSGSRERRALFSA